jgi:hypothetical protein
MIHQAETKEDLMLAPDFYGTSIWSSVFFPRWEIEILEPKVPRGETGKLNYHYSDKDNKPYVCFPGALPTIEALMSMLNLWVIGQVCVMELDRYFNEMIETVGGKEAFIFWAKTQQGIDLDSNAPIRIKMGTEKEV